MKIACVLVTHLPLKAELRRCPELQSKPVVIVESYGSKDVVLDSSPEARGIIAGMSLQEAMSRRKDAALVGADQPHYDEVFDGIIDALQGRSPLVEKGDLGCAYVGLDGLEEMYGGEPQLITSLLQSVPSQFNPRVGVAMGKFPAYVAAVTSGGGRATRTPEPESGRLAKFLKDFTVDLLPLPWKERARLHQFGLHTLGQVAALPVGAVQAQLGPAGKIAWELASGVDSSPLVPYRPEESVTEFLTFPSPTITQYAVLTAIGILLGRAFARPQTKGKYVRTATIESHIVRHPPWVKRFSFKEAVGSRERALFAIKSRMDTIALPGPLEDMALTLAGLTGESGMQSSFFSDVRKREQLKEMMRQLEALMGRRPPIYQIKEVEPWSRIPERRQALAPFDP